MFGIKASDFSSKVSNYLRNEFFWPLQMMWGGKKLIWVNN